MTHEEPRTLRVDGHIDFFKKKNLNIWVEVEY
jgi:hypothetical protein